MGKTCMNTIEVEVHHEKIYGMQSFAYLSTTWNYYKLQSFFTTGARPHGKYIGAGQLGNTLELWNVAELAYGPLVTCYGNRIR